MIPITAPTINPIWNNRSRAPFSEIGHTMSTERMLTVYSPEHIFHAPRPRPAAGAHSETPERAFTLLEATAQRLGPVLPPEEFGMQSLLAVHSPDDPAYLEQAYERWVAQGNDPAGVLPHTFASRHTLPLTPSPSPEGEGKPPPFPNGRGVGGEGQFASTNRATHAFEHTGHRRHAAGAIQ